MNQKTLSKAYRDNIIENSFAYKDKPVKGIGRFDESLLENQLLFWTVMPDRRNVPNTINGSMNFLQRLSEDVHVQIVKHSINRCWNSTKFAQHPATYYFLESAGARCSYKGNLYFLNSPHIHALTVFRTENSIRKINKQTNFLHLKESISSLSQVSSSKLKWFDDERGSLFDLVDYCVKYAFMIDQTNKLPFPAYNMIDPNLVDFIRKST